MVKEFLNASNWLQGRALSHVKTKVLISWQNPERGWIKVNSNGLVWPSFSTTCGGVCKDKSGNWLMGFCRHIGILSVTIVELRGLYIAMELA